MKNLNGGISPTEEEVKQEEETGEGSEGGGDAPKREVQQQGEETLTPSVQAEMESWPDPLR